MNYVQQLKSYFFYKTSQSKPNNMMIAPTANNLCADELTNYKPKKKSVVLFFTIRENWWK